MQLLTNKDFAFIYRSFYNRRLSKDFLFIQQAAHREYDCNQPFMVNAFAQLLFFSLYFLLKKNYGEALHWAEQIDRPAILWDPMLRACALGHLDRTKEALKNLELLKQLVPDAGNHVKDIIESFLLSQEVNNEILGGLQKAGLAIGHQKP